MVNHFNVLNKLRIRICILEKGWGIAITFQLLLALRWQSMKNIEFC